VDDVGGGAPLGRVPARLGELVVLHGGTVFVVACGRAQIHAYTIGILPSSVKRFFSIRVSMSGGRIGEAPLDFPCFSVLSWPMCALAPQTRVRGTGAERFRYLRPMPPAVGGQARAVGREGAPGMRGEQTPRTPLHRCCARIGLRTTSPPSKAEASAPHWREQRIKPY
jgi:hypothetical protein